VLVYVRSKTSEPEEPLDLDALAAAPRRAEPAPSADEVRGAIEERLDPASIYRVTFAVQPDAEPTAEEIGW
jgi:hypothetical protein